jgi:hypothetical protein
MCVSFSSVCFTSWSTGGRITAAAGFAFPSTCLCIQRRLYRIISHPSVDITRAEVGNLKRDTPFIFWRLSFKETKDDHSRYCVVPRNAYSQHNVRYVLLLIINPRICYTSSSICCTSTAIRNFGRFRMRYPDRWYCLSYSVCPGMEIIH